MDRWGTSDRHGSIQIIYRRMTRTVQRGYLWLTIVLLAVLGVLWFAMPSTPSNAQSATLPDSIDTGGTTDSAETHRDASSMAAVKSGKRREVIVDLNTADTLTLQMLRGIGSARARYIVRYRQQLGGYVKMEQLKEVYSIDDTLYAELLPHLVLSRDSLRQIAINSVGIKQLMRHPYIDPYQARDVIAYRQQGHRYEQADDLLVIPSMDAATVERLKPYLSFE